jgi:hypothetical protein
MKLLLDVLSKANLPYPFDIAGPRTEANPIENVNDGLVVVSWCPVQSSLNASDGGEQRGGCSDQKGTFPEAVHTSIRHMTTGVR